MTKTLLFPAPAALVVLAGAFFVPGLSAADQPVKANPLAGPAVDADAPRGLGARNIDGSMRRP